MKTGLCPPFTRLLSLFSCCSAGLQRATVCMGSSCPFLAPHSLLGIHTINGFGWNSRLFSDFLFSCHSSESRSASISRSSYHHLLDFSFSFPRGHSTNIVTGPPSDLNHFLSHCERWSVWLRQQKGLVSSPETWAKFSKTYSLGRGWEQRKTKKQNLRAGNRTVFTWEMESLKKYICWWPLS